MTKDELRLLVKAMRSVYTSENFFPEGNLQYSLRVWFEILQDIPYETASAAVMKYMSTNHFPPTPADIREACAQAQIGVQRDWLQGWDAMRRAIRRYGYMREKEAMQALRAVDPIAADTVERLGYQALCASENEVADRANFRMCYENATKREKEVAVLPPSVREVLSGVAGKLQIGGSV